MKSDVDTTHVARGASVRNDGAEFGKGHVRTGTTVEIIPIPCDTWPRREPAGNYGSFRGLLAQYVMHLAIKGNSRRAGADSCGRARLC